MLYGTYLIWWIGGFDDIKTAVPNVNKVTAASISLPILNPQNKDFYQFTKLNCHQHFILYIAPCPSHAEPPLLRPRVSPPLFLTLPSPA